MDPVTAISLVASILGVTDLITRSLKGLRGLQAVYSSADTLIVMVVGWLHTVRDALDEISEWAQEIQSQLQPAKLLAKIDSAVACCAIPLGVLLDKIEALRKHAVDDKLTSRGRLAYVLGESEIKLMSLHLNHQVQALNLLMTAARCKTPQDCNEVLQNEETQTILRRIQDDSNSYRGNNSESASIITRRSLLTEHTEYLDAEFKFDDEVFNSHVYKNAYRMMLEKKERPRRHSDGRAVIDDQHVADRDRHTPQNTRMTSVRRWDMSRLYAVLTREAPEIRAEKNRDEKVGRPLEYWARNEPDARVESSGSAATGSCEKVPTGPQERAHKQSNEGIGQMLRFWTKSHRQPDVVIEQQAPRQEQIKHKVLLLGTGESGKDTLLKNIKFKGTGFWSNDELDSWKEIIFSNLLLGVRTVLEAMDSLDIRLFNPVLKCHRQIILMQHLSMGMCDIMPAQIRYAVLSLRGDAGFQECMRRSREYQLVSSFRYLFSQADRICHPDYTPTNEDTLQIYVHTTGTTKTTWSRGESCFHIFNAGGHRSQRKKWIHSFERVSAVVFVVDMSEYDLLLWEDETVNRAQESLTLFCDIVNSSRSVNTDFILLLAKVDLFEGKLPESPLRKYYTDYEGSTLEEAKAHVLSRYVGLIEHDRGLLYTNFVNLTDMEFMNRELDIIAEKLEKQEALIGGRH